MSPPAVRYVGFLGEASGYGVAARAHLRALVGAGVSVAPRSVRLWPAPSDLPTPISIARRCGAAPEAWETALLHVTPPALPSVREEGARNVGVTVWETEELPAAWHGALAAVDELWVPSRFSALAFARATRRPVRVVPHPVALRPRRRRSWPGIDDGAFVFLSLFEWSDRKNPLGLVRAFSRAFAGRRDVALLLKIGLRLGADPRAIVRDLTAAAGARGPEVHLVLEPLGSGALERLYQRADAYVSLHRAEGFGLCIAEAMARGLPVVATGWSGNLEYMDDASALLVGHRMANAERTLYPQAPWDERMQWAEPRIDEAVDMLRAMADSPSLRERLAAAGRARIAERLDPRAIGLQMRALLEADPPPVE